MTLDEEARLAAHAAYPDPAGATASLPALVANNPEARAMARTPYAHGYQAGYAAALATIPSRDAIEERIAQALDGDAGPGVPPFLADLIFDLLQGRQ